MHITQIFKVGQKPWTGADCSRFHLVYISLHQQCTLKQSQSIHNPNKEKSEKLLTNLINPHLLRDVFIFYILAVRLPATVSKHTVSLLKELAYHGCRLAAGKIMRVSTVVSFFAKTMHEVSERQQNIQADQTMFQLCHNLKENQCLSFTFKSRFNFYIWLFSLNISHVTLYRNSRTVNACTRPILYDLLLLIRLLSESVQSTVYCTSLLSS